MRMHNAPYVGWFIGAGFWCLVSWTWSASAPLSSELVWLPLIMAALHVGRGFYVLLRKRKPTEENSGAA